MEREKDRIDEQGEQCGTVRCDARYAGGATCKNTFYNFNARDNILYNDEIKCWHAMFWSVNLWILWLNRNLFNFFDYNNINL